MRLAIVAGSGVEEMELAADLRPRKVSTPYGDAHALIGRRGGGEVALLLRHGAGHSVPPHLVNYRANVWALRELGVERVIATAAVGALTRELKPGDLVVCDQFIDFTRGRAGTFYDGGAAGVAHTDLSEPFCPELRATLLGKAAGGAGGAGGGAAGDVAAPHDGGCYVCAEGPRYETAAEVRAFAILGGDVVGMTACPEAALAREAGLCYALLAIVTNWATGIAPQPLSHAEVVATVAGARERVRAVLDRALTLAPVERRCRCGASTSGATSGAPPAVAPPAEAPPAEAAPGGG